MHIGSLPVDFWVGLASSLVATIVAKLAVRLYRWLFSRKPEPLQLAPGLASNPIVHIRFVFDRVRDAGRRLHELIGWHVPLCTEVKASVFLFYLLAGVSIQQYRTGYAPWIVSVLTVLLLSLLLSFILWINEPERPQLYLALAPFACLTTLALVFYRSNGLGRKHMHQLEQAMWHLLVALPSSNSVHKTLKRKTEHAEHLGEAIAILEQLASAFPNFEEIRPLIRDLRLALDDIRTQWPDSCDELFTARIPELNVVTEQGYLDVEDEL